MRRRYFPVLFGSSGGRTETLTYQPDNTTGQDTYVDSGSADTDRSATEIFRIANAGRFSLVKFPIVIGAGGVPQTGVLSIWNDTVVAADIVISAYRILDANSAWAEASTWNYKTPSTARWAGDAAGDGGADGGCSVAGTDYSATPLGSFTYTTSTGAGTLHTMTLDPTELALMCASNNGFILRSNKANTINFRSCENTFDVTHHPKLVLTVHYA